MPETIDLFAGAGGLSLGLHAAGFFAVEAFEWDDDACRTYRNALPDTKMTAGPVQDVEFKRFKGIDLIAAGPPCQPFSSGGKGLAAEDDRDMMPQFIRAIREARPKAFLLENVPGLATVRHHKYLSAVVEAIENLGYRVSYRVLNAADFGVPQKRRRLFVVGAKKKTYLDFPEPTHGPSSKNGAHIPASAVLDIGYQPKTPNPSRVVYARNPDPRPSPYDGHLFNGGGRPIDLQQPCHTILAAAGGNKTHFIDTLGIVPPYHASLLAGGKPRKGFVEGARRLTPEESAKIQTFPCDMEFFGSRSSQYTQIGNAVPPKLAQALGEALMAQLHPE
jgi:DNA (cytosine-5)-methyltransferase 1